MTFGNDLTDGSSIESENDRTQYGALGDTEREARENYFNYFVYGLKANNTVPSKLNQSCKQSYKRE